MWQNKLVLQKCFNYSDGWGISEEGCWLMGSPGNTELLSLPGNISQRAQFGSNWSCTRKLRADTDAEWRIKLPTGERALVRPSSRALTRVYKCKGFPSILWGRLTDKWLQLIDGHISKHCLEEGLGCGNRFERVIESEYGVSWWMFNDLWGWVALCGGVGVCVFTKETYI